jgi:hypothetical protein
MSLQRPIATSFNGGELSPRMGGRVDTAIYAVGLETAENFVPTVEGAIAKRPGFEYIRDAAETASWVSAFRFNLTQQYLIEWSEGKLRFYTNGERIETAPNVPYEVVVPYSAAEAPFVSAFQSFDRLYLDHPDHPPAALTRTGASTFAYAATEMQNGPFADGNSDETVTVSASATTGIVTLTASSAIFAAGHVGALFRLEALDFAAIKVWQVGIAGVTIGKIYRNEGNVYTALTAGRTGTAAPVHTSGTAWDGDDDAAATDVNAKGPFGVQWEFRHDRFGMLRITAVAPDGLSATATVLRRLPDALISVPSWRWAHALFSAEAGWPNVVLGIGSRLCHIRNFDLAASVVGDYQNHLTTTASGLTPADLAFRRPILTEDPVLWAASDRNRILAGTASREIAIGAINAAQAISGDNIEAVPQSYYGSERVFPLQIGTVGVFVQRAGRKLRQFEYDFARDRYAATNMTVWCRHITKGGIVQLAFQKEPEELMIGVRADGQAVVHPHAPEQEIKGFARYRHSDGAGSILSATCIASADGKSDELWALVERGGAKSIERQAAWRDDDDPRETSFFVDSGVTAIATMGQTHFSGLSHLAGEAVAVLADGGVVTGITVAGDGTFDLPASVVPADRPYIITVGLPYTATVVTLRPELRTELGTSQGVRQRLVRLALRLLGSAGLRIGALGGKLDQLVDRQGNDHMDAGVPLFFGDSERAVSGGWGIDGRATFISDVPLPAVVVAALPKVDPQS